MPVDTSAARCDTSLTVTKPLTSAKKRTDVVLVFSRITDRIQLCDEILEFVIDQSRSTFNRALQGYQSCCRDDRNAIFNNKPLTLRDVFLSLCKDYLSPLAAGMRHSLLVVGSLGPTSASIHHLYFSPGNNPVRGPMFVKSMHHCLKARRDSVHATT
ncbi:hypothetical protein K0M31_014993 [Melipona bicolor]|uniref:Uncharacterized protein n=1 Tax=Melipona bicolor TaxID=60889 RepID=A0AA40FGN9_9HYME|nr:hypothetical protein K0M31_014993 [Melipona bicolor]